MKKSILSIAILLMSISSFAINVGNNAPEICKGQYGGTAYYELTNIDLGFGLGCDYWVEMTVTVATQFGLRTRVFSTTMSPGDTWEFSVAYATNETIIAEIVHIIGVGFPINYTVDANENHWWPWESCNATSVNWGTRWTPNGGKSYEFGEDLLLGGE
jgi:hypothetical protein